MNLKLIGLLLIFVGLTGLIILTLSSDSSTQIVKNDTKEKSILYQVIENETIPLNNSEWVCRDYALYLNETLKTKYPTLDVRVIRYFDLCNNLTFCDDYHAFIVVGGYGSECIVNSKQITCIDNFNVTINSTNITK